MTKILIGFIFANKDDMPEGMVAKAIGIVREEYAKVFNCPERELEVSACNAHANRGEVDIHLLIDTDCKYYNTGMLRMEMKQCVAKRLLLLFPNRYGFRGMITCADGKVDGKPAGAPEKDGQPHKNDALRKDDSATDYSERAKMYPAQEARFGFEMLKLPERTIGDIERALARIELEREIFQEWGLYAIMPSPNCAMTFFGPPGTGKSLAAEALACKLNKKIIRVSYADIESMYVGEGPKNVSAVFLAAEQQDAVLFIDEADSLLSKRLTNVSHGSDQAINSMRSQMLICLERFHGIVIFATNLVVNYDRAFLSRLVKVKFEFPDAQMRSKIWASHLYPREGNGVMLNIPLAQDVNTDLLGEEFEVCGREIRNAVVDACVSVKLEGSELVTQKHLRDGAIREIEHREEVLNAEDHTALKSSVIEPVKKVLEKITKDAPVVSEEQLDAMAGQKPENG